MTAITGPFGLDGVRMPAWLLRFDKHGACTSPVTRDKLLALLATGAHSDVIFFSHGWNNDFADVVAMYARFLKALEAQIDAEPLARPEGYAPLFVGVSGPASGCRSMAANRSQVLPHPRPMTKRPMRWPTG
jgi:hypothetical protein